ncbi:MAG: VWA domain-containing protein [Bacteroidales bacterium]|nr:VWA domain-containing protein [Bacteroidales bacterium]
MTKLLKTSLYILTILLFTQCEGDLDTESHYNRDAYEDETIDPQFEDYGENPFMKVKDAPISTFSVDADGGSYAVMRRYMSNGMMPNVASVRIEEYLNYFTFQYNDPTDGEHVALNSEMAVCPWNVKHHLLRLGIKGKTIPTNELPYSNFVFLIDVSGSMGGPDKLELLKSGFKLLADNLRDYDRIAIVTYAGTAHVLLESTDGENREKIKAAIDQLGTGGNTAGAAGIVKAYEIASENFIPGGNNRVILGTDGDFNVGISSDEALVNLIEEKRESGIFLTALGVGINNLNDRMMEKVANSGNGVYEYIDNPAQIEKVFVHEISKFYSVAQDCKIQVKFNGEKVESYRLIGYENRALDDSDFKNDSVDAGEIGAGQTITALYEVILKSNDKNEHYANFDVRYKKNINESSRLLQHSITNAPVEMNNASENMRFAATVAGFGMAMKQSKYKGSLNKRMILKLGNNAITYDPNGYRKELMSLISEWKE